MKKLELLELTNNELVLIEGGKWKKFLEGLAEYIAVDQAFDYVYSEFMEGWNSVECGC